jgi:sulfopyruvate decarboxylase TPP-binding subunit
VGFNVYGITSVTVSITVPISKVIEGRVAKFEQSALTGPISVLIKVIKAFPEMIEEVPESITARNTRGSVGVGITIGSFFPTVMLARLSE